MIFKGALSMEKENVLLPAAKPEPNRPKDVHELIFSLHPEWSASER